MTEAGLRVVGEHGAVQVDSTHVNWGFKSTGTVAMTLDPANHPNDMQIGQVRVTGTNVLVAFAAAGQYVNLERVVQEGADWVYHFRAQTKANFNLTWWSFDAAGTALGSSSPYGLAVRDASGVPTFYGTTDPLTIVDFITAPTTYPAGRIYAVIQSSQRILAERTEGGEPDLDYGVTPGNKLQQNTSYYSAANVSGNVVNAGLIVYEDYKDQVPADTPLPYTLDGGNMGWIVVDVTDLGNIDTSDYTLDPVTWPSVTNTTTEYQVEATTQYKTMNGIAQQVLINVTATYGTFGGASVTALSNTRGVIGTMDANGLLLFAVNPGEQIAFKVQGQTASGTKTGTVTLTIKNQSDGNVQLSKTNFTLTADSDNNYNVIDKVVDSYYGGGTLTANTTAHTAVTNAAICRVMGVNVQLDLRLSISGRTSGPTGLINTASLFLYRSPTGADGTWTLISSISAKADNFIDFTMNNGEYNKIDVEFTTLSGKKEHDFNVTVVNVSNSNQLLTTFAVDGTVDSDDNYMNDDFVPVPINFPDLTLSNVANQAGVYSPIYTLSGVNRPVTLRVTTSNITNRTMEDGYLYAIRQYDGLAYGGVRHGLAAGGAGTGSFDFTIPVGEEFRFYFDGLSNLGKQTVKFDVTVTNLSDSGTVFDTFKCDGTVDSDDNHNVDQVPDALTLANKTEVTNANILEFEDWTYVDGINRAIQLRVERYNFTNITALELTTSTITVYKSPRNTTAWASVGSFSAKGTGQAFIDFTLNPGEKIRYVINSTTSDNRRSGSFDLVVWNLNNPGGALQLSNKKMTITVDNDNNYNNADYIPNAINWPDVSHVSLTERSEIGNGYQTITGINQSLNLQLTLTSVTGGWNAGELQVYKNGAYANIAINLVGGTNVVYLNNIVSGDTLSFYAYADTASGRKSGTISAKLENVTVGTPVAVLDTFNITLTADDDNNYNNDVIPDAINWPDIVYTTTADSAQGVGGSQTITGLSPNLPITLRATITNITKNEMTSPLFGYQINGGPQVNMTITNNSSLDFVVYNGNVINFRSSGSTTLGKRQQKFTVTITNASTGTVYDSFIVDGTVDSDDDAYVDAIPDNFNFVNTTLNDVGNNPTVYHAPIQVTGTNRPFDLSVSITNRTDSMEAAAFYLQTATSSNGPWTTVLDMDVIGENLNIAYNIEPGTWLRFLASGYTSMGYRTLGFTVTLHKYNVITQQTVGAPLGSAIWRLNVDTDNNYNRITGRDWANIDLNSVDNYSKTNHNGIILSELAVPHTLRTVISNWIGNIDDGYLRMLHYQNNVGPGIVRAQYRVINGNGSMSGTANPGDHIYWDIDADTQSGVKTASFTATVYDDTDGGRLVDSFNVTITVDSDNNYNIPDYAADTLALSPITFITNGNHEATSQSCNLTGINRSVTLRFERYSFSGNIDAAMVYIYRRPAAGGTWVEVGRLDPRGTQLNYIEAVYAHTDAIQILYDSVTYSGRKNYLFDMVVWNMSNPGGPNQISNNRINITVDDDNNYLNDYTPEPLNWSDININTPANALAVSNPYLAVAGINQAINLRGTISGLNSTLSSGTLEFWRNGGLVSSTTLFNGAIVDCSANNGDEVCFVAYGETTLGRKTAGYKVTVVNTSTSTTLDTFNVDITVDSDDNYNVDYTPNAFTIPGCFAIDPNLHNPQTNVSYTQITGINRPVRLRFARVHEGIYGNVNTQTQSISIANSSGGPWTEYILGYNQSIEIDFTNGQWVRAYANASTTSGAAGVAWTTHITNVTTGASLGNFYTNIQIDQDNNYNVVDQTFDAIDWNNHSFNVSGPEGASATSYRVMSGINTNTQIRVEVVNKTGLNGYPMADDGTIYITSSTRGNLAQASWKNTGVVYATVQPNENIRIYIDAYTGQGRRDTGMDIYVYNHTTGAFIDHHYHSHILDNDNNHNVIDKIPNNIAFSQHNSNTAFRYSTVNTPGYTITGINSAITLLFYHGIYYHYLQADDDFGGTADVNGFQYMIIYRNGVQVANTDPQYKYGRASIAETYSTTTAVFNNGDTLQFGFATSSDQADMNNTGRTYVQIQGRAYIDNLDNPGQRLGDFLHDTYLFRPQGINGG